MESNLEKFLVPDLLRQALPILHANFPTVVKHLAAPFREERRRRLPPASPQPPPSLHPASTQPPLTALPVAAPPKSTQEPFLQVRITGALKRGKKRQKSD